jgi:hypothetical protein
MKKLYWIAVIICGLAVGCQKQTGSENGGREGPPHGGTAVAMGRHRYNLELVRDGEAGTLQAYVLDAHFEKFVMVRETNFTLIAKVGEREERAEFAQLPAAPPASDGSSYQFAARG